MNKKKVLLFVVSLILIMVMSFSLVACDKDQTTAGTEEDTPLQVGNGDEGATYGDAVIANEAMTFDIVAEKTMSSQEVRSLISVKSSKGAVVDVTVSQLDTEGKVFRVYPPQGLYTYDTYGTKYFTIEIGKGLSFKYYQKGISKLPFNITETLNDSIKLVDGIVAYSSSLVTNINETDQTFNFLTNGGSLEVGQVIVVYDAETNEKSAYKIKAVTAYSDALLFVEYETPSLEEVYTKFKYEATEKLTAESDVNIDIKAVEDSLDESALAQSAISLFGKAPQFAVTEKGINKNEAGVYVVKLVFTMTVPNVVEINGTDALDLVLKFDCEVGVDANTYVNKLPSGVDFSLSADVNNKITTTVTLGNSYTVNETPQITEIINKLKALADESQTSEESGAKIPVFTWVVPVANGAASITYDAKLALRFAFSGEFNVIAESSFSYSVGAGYNSKDGLTHVAKYNEDFSIDSVNVNMKGNVTAKVGILQEIGLDILGGVFGVGVTAEVGNYNKVFGYVKTDNLIDKDVDVTGAVYLDGGLYYDVDVELGLAYSKLNLNKKIDVAQGEISLYEAGQKELITEVSDVNIKLTSEETVMPKAVASVTDLTNLNKYAKEVSIDSITVDNELLTISNGIITIKNFDTATTFNVSVSCQLAQMFSKANVKLNISYDTALVLEDATLDFDKTASKDLEIVISDKSDKVTDYTAVSVYAGDALVAEGTGKTITVAKETLYKMDSGLQVLTVKANGNEASAFVNITGKVGVKQIPNSNGVYKILSKDQILAMQGQDIEGKFELACNIDLGGAEISGINKLKGSLNGKGYAISNYTVKTSGDAAFVKELDNNSSVINLVLAGDVEATVYGKYGETYSVAGAVANNNGIVQNVTVLGKVTLNTTSTTTATYKVAGIAANSDVVSGCLFSGDLTVNTKYDIAGCHIYAGANTSTSGKVTVNGDVTKDLFTSLECAE